MLLLSILTGGNTLPVGARADDVGKGGPLWSPGVGDVDGLFLRLMPITPRWWSVTKLVSSAILSGERNLQESKQATLELVSRCSTARFIEANASYLAKE